MFGNRRQGDFKRFSNIGDGHVVLEQHRQDAAPGRVCEGGKGKIEFCCHEKGLACVGETVNRMVEGLLCAGEAGRVNGAISETVGVFWFSGGEFSTIWLNTAGVLILGAQRMRVPVQR